ncbi:hypothetical protein [Mycoplasma buteonis]|uniref:hypothetical protein n=1 Tax=Mycoplasma buteonis TaxID=171280 RepID=UPI000562ED48|nr:hypothetical protein [Mycoplasma buteonis]
MKKIKFPKWLILFLSFISLPLLSFSCQSMPEDKIQIKENKPEKNQSIDNQTNESNFDLDSVENNKNLDATTTRLPEDISKNNQDPNYLPKENNSVAKSKGDKQRNEIDSSKNEEKENSEVLAKKDLSTNNLNLENGEAEESNSFNLKETETRIDEKENQDLSKNIKETKSINIKSITLVFEQENLMKNKMTSADFLNNTLDLTNYIKSVRAIDWEDNLINISFPSLEYRLEVDNFKNTNIGYKINLKLLKKDKIVYSGSNVFTEGLNYSKSDYLNYLLENQVSLKKIDREVKKHFPSFFVAKKLQDLDLSSLFLNLNSDYQMFDHFPILIRSNYYANDNEGKLFLNYYLEYNNENTSETIISNSKNIEVLDLSSLNLDNDFNFALVHTFEFPQNEKIKNKIFSWYEQNKNKDNLALSKFDIARLFRFLNRNLYRMIEATQNENFELSLSNNYNLVGKVLDTNFVISGSHSENSFNLSNGLLANQIQILRIDLEFEGANFTKISDNRLELNVQYKILVTINGATLENWSNTKVLEFQGNLPLYFQK